MKEFFKVATGTTAILFFLFVVYSTLNYAQSSEHEWVPGDLVYVNHMCSNATVLQVTANLYQLATEESVKQAEDAWMYAILNGMCVTSPENFLIKLETMIQHFPNLFGADGYHGELWSAYTLLPDGTPIRVYAGVIAKEFASQAINLNNYI